MVRKKRKALIKAVKKDGKWLEWNENGQKKLERIFKDGKLISTESIIN